jgi:retron-type reverse transcriptase
LGIPTVVDRLVQQAIAQVLEPRLEPSFSASSFGFRPGRSAHDALRQAREYVADGYDIVVDLDLEKFFDRVNHDMLARVADGPSGAAHWRPPPAAHRAALPGGRHDGGWGVSRAV